MEEDVNLVLPTDVQLEIIQNTIKYYEYYSTVPTIDKFFMSGMCGIIHTQILKLNLLEIHYCRYADIYRYIPLFVHPDGEIFINYWWPRDEQGRLQRISYLRDIMDKLLKQKRDELCQQT